MQPAGRRGSRFSYGWVIVAVSFVLLIGSFGTQMCFGLFLKPLAAEFGWSRAAVAGSMSLLMAVSGLIGVVMGRVTDRWGARAGVTPGVVVGSACFLLLARIDSLWQFYVLFGVGGGLLAGCSYTPAVAAVSGWFDVKRRTMAIGVTLLGVIAGQMILSPVISHVIDSVGWRPAWVILAAVAFLTGLPAILLIGRKPLRVGSVSGEAVPAAAGLTAGEAGRTLAFWLLMLSGVVLGLGFYAFSAHVVPYATDVGVSTAAAALILTVSSLGGIAGSLLAGPISSKLGDRWSLLVLTALNGAVLFFFIAAGSAWAFYVLAAMLAFAFSGVVPIRMAVIPPLFGVRAVGSIIGYASLSFSVGAVGGPFLAGYIFDTTGNYDLAFLIFGILLLAGGLSLYFLRAPRKARAPKEEVEPAAIWRAEDGLG